MGWQGRWLVIRPVLSTGTSLGVAAGPPGEVTLSVERAYNPQEHNRKTPISQPVMHGLVWISH